MLTTRQAAAAIVLTTLCGIASAQSRPAATSAPKLPFEISKDTTRLTSPLRPDGRVDYVAAIDAQRAQGVTKDNNAAIPLIEIVGPDNVLSPSDRDEICQILGVRPDPKATSFDPTPANKSEYDKARTKVWQANECPEAAKWLAGNAQPLKSFIEATRRPRFYIPYVKSGKDGGLVETNTPRLGSYRAAARMLAMRANLAVAEGRGQDAWADIQAIYRLADLLNQDSTFIGRLVAIACSALADGATWNLATSGSLDAKTAMAMLAELPSPQTAPTVIDVVNEGERYLMLDNICRCSLTPPAQWAISLNYLRRQIPAQPMTASQQASRPSDEDIANLLRPASAPSVDEVMYWAAFMKDVDWSAMLRRTNTLYDSLVAALATKDLAQREKLIKEFDKETLRISEGALKQPTARDARELRTQWIGDVLITLLIPSLTRGQTLADRGAVMHQLSSVALAMAAFKAEKGHYPIMLDDLVPGYLKEVPSDFFAEGKNGFVYRLTGDGGYVLYSVGENGVDDSGKDRDQGGDDIVVRAPPSAAKN